VAVVVVAALVAISDVVASVVTVVDIPAAVWQ
jgi:hypothetical protein